MRPQRDAKLKLEPHVRRLEELPAADLPTVYRGAGVLVLPLAL
jgi:hypothetical protein